MTVLEDVERLAVLLGTINASTIPSKLIFCLALMYFFMIFASSSSTSRRKARFSLMISINRWTNSSCLSFKSLCPRFAVESCLLTRVNSMRVGLTVPNAICYSSFGKYLLIFSTLIRLSSVLGKIVSNFQPISSVSSMVRAVV